jgi:hypothetical protein
MSLKAWRLAIATCAVLVGCLALYEGFAPRVQLFDGSRSPVGPWFAIPGRATARYQVHRVPPHSDLAAAGVQPGDLIVPNDAFAAYWLTVPGERVPVTVVHQGLERQVTIVASSRPLTMNRIQWIVRIGRLVLRLAMLALAFIIAWQLPDALWTRALCAFLVLFGISPWQPEMIEYHGWLRVVALVLENSATQAGLCAAVIFAATIPDAKPHDARIWMLRLWPLAFIVMEACIVGMLFDLRMIYVTAPLRFTQLACMLATVAGLTAAAEEATGQERQRLRYLTWTIGLGFSGFFVSILLLWFHGTGWGAFQALSLPRLTLLFIPFGIAYGLLSHRVISSNYIASRTLVYGALTSSLVPIFTGSEFAATSLFSNSQSKNAFLVALTVIVTASFKTVHTQVNALFDKWIFRERHAGEKAMAKFVNEVEYIHDGATLADRCMTLIDQHVKPQATAMYIHAEPETLADHNARADYARMAFVGEGVPERIDELDPAVLALKGERDAVEFDTFGKGGHAFPMMMRAHLIGFIAIGPKRDGEILAPDEIKRLNELSYRVAVALEVIRVNDLEARLTQAETGRAELRRLLTDLVRPTNGSDSPPATDGAAVSDGAETVEAPAQVPSAS